MTRTQKAQSKIKRGKAAIAAFLFSLSFAGCATYQSKVKEARDALAARDPAKAVSLLEPLEKKQNDDQIAMSGTGG